MALSNRDRISRGFELLAEGLEAPVDQVMTKVFNGRSDWNDIWAARDGRGQTLSKSDPRVLLAVNAPDSADDVRSHCGT